MVLRSTIARPRSSGVWAARRFRWSGRELFHEIDHRPGYYVGAQARYLDRAVLNVLHYDNRADPTAYSPRSTTSPGTPFRRRGAASGNGRRVDGLVQWLVGRHLRRAGDAAGVGVRLALRAACQASASTCSPCVRRLRSRMGQWNEPGDNEDGHAWTVAYSFDQRQELALHARVAARSQRRGRAAGTAGRACSGDRDESGVVGPLAIGGSPSGGSVARRSAGSAPGVRSSRSSSADSATLWVCGHPGSPAALQTDAELSAIARPAGVAERVPYVLHSASGDEISPRKRRGPRVLHRRALGGHGTGGEAGRRDTGVLGRRHDDPPGLRIGTHAFLTK